MEFCMLNDASPDDELGLHLGDAREAGMLLAAIGRRLNPRKPDTPFLTVTITSPPYADLINYGMAGQIGFGQSWHEYLSDCEKLFSSLHHWTRSDGCLWLVADTFLEPSSGRRKRVPSRPNELRLLPFDLSAAAQRAGWILREVVIWHKDRTLPWSAKGRLRNSFEYVLLLVKSNEFQYHVDRLRDQTDMSRWWVRYPERYNPRGVAPDNVWSIPIPVQGSWYSKMPRHDCPFPPDLVRRALLLSSEANDIIFDPFAGSGTALAVAEAMGRRALGIELNPDFVDAYHQKMYPNILKEWSRRSDPIPSTDIARTIWSLRALKYPKTMISQLRNTHSDSDVPSLALVLVDDWSGDPLDTSVLSLSIAFVLDGVSETSRDEVRGALKALSLKRPLSVFGISVDISVVNSTEFIRLSGNRSLYLYEGGHTWMTSGVVSAHEALEVPISRSPGHHRPVVSNVELKVRFPEND
jgi:DNA modification methylase